MSNPQDLIIACQSRLSREGVSEEVLAAGVFAQRDNYKAITAGGLASSFVPGAGNPLLGGLQNGVANEASRQANAAAHGVTERMMVCVTDPEIYIFALRAPSGHDPQEILASFDRGDTEVEVKKFGKARHLNISEGERKLTLTGSSGGLSRESGGDKAVLAVIG